MKFDDAINKLDEQTRQKLAECKSVDEMVRLFKENNIDISVSDMEDVVRQQGELSDDELETVVGGIDLSFLVQELLKLIVDKIKKL